MLNKTYHTIEVTGPGKSAILWVDGYGREGKVDSEESDRFEKEHPRSVFLMAPKFYKHLELVRRERAKIEDWNTRSI